MPTLRALLPMPAADWRGWMLVVRRVVWLIPLWLLGSYASQTLGSYYGSDRIPSAAHWVVIVALAASAGVIGGLMLVAKRWRAVFVMALLGAAVWGSAFVSAIPTTKAVCGGDATYGCEHVQAIEWPLVAGAAYPVLLVGLVVPFGVFWRFAPKRAVDRRA